MRRHRSAIVAALLILPAVMAGGLFAAQPATEGDLAILDAIQTQSAADAAFHAQVIFLLQACAIPIGMLLGISIFSTWLRGRQSRLP